MALKVWFTNCQKIVLTGVGAKMIIPYEMGKLTGMNELILMGHGMNSPVSGWMAVRMTVCAFLNLLMSSTDVKTLL